MFILCEDGRGAVNVLHLPAQRGIHFTTAETKTDTNAFQSPTEN